MEYTQEQLKAIETNDKNLRIIASAGSGKTTTVAAKIAYLLDSKNQFDVSPENIIAFTYTEKAAAELKDKVLSKVKPQKGMADMYIGTIHGWCLKVLQDNEYKYQKYSVLDEIKLQLFIDKYYDKIGMKDVTKLISPFSCMKRFVDTKRFVRIMDIIRESELSSPLPDNLEIAKQKYEKMLHEKNYFDFSMIIDETLKCLNDSTSNLCSYISERIKYIVVDEYQDINPKQEALLEKLFSISNAKITVVGDDDQNIYQWRGSNNDFIIHFDEKFAPCESVMVTKNFRSSSGITKLSETLIKNNTERLSKTIVSAESQSFQKGIDILYNEYDTVSDENIGIANFIQKLVGIKFSDEKDGLSRGLAYSDMCILLRTWKKAEGIVSELEKHGIPYVTAGVNHLFDTTEIKASLGIFRYLNGYLSQEELMQMWEELPFVEDKKQTIQKAIFNLEDIKPTRISQRLQNGEKISDEEFAYNLQKIFWQFLEDSQITEESFCDGTSESQELAEVIFYNFGKFSQVINDFEEINFATSRASYHLFSFLSFINYAAQEYYPEGWISNPYKSLNAVQVLTIHQAKGLEFPVVFVPGLNKNYLPQKRKGGLSEWHFLDPSIIKNQNRYLGSDDDERRLLYVAITRSQKYLLLSRAPDPTNRLYQNESMFVQEMTSANILVSRKDEDFSSLERGESKPLSKINSMILDFTVLKDYFDCPYKFKLVSIYGFASPLNQRMGFGKSFHNALMELHRRIQKKDKLTDSDVVDIANRQMLFPYIANSDILKPKLENKIREGLLTYYITNRNDLNNIVFVEQPIQLKLDTNILVTGRVDLIRKTKENNTFETTIVEFKSKEEAQSSRLTDDQLKLYALGHKELTGEVADYLMTYIVGDNQAKVPYKLKNSDLDEISSKITKSASQIRLMNFPKVCEKVVCSECLQNALCEGRTNSNVKSALKR